MITIGPSTSTRSTFEKVCYFHVGLLNTKKKFPDTGPNAKGDALLWLFQVSTQDIADSHATVQVYKWKPRVHKISQELSCLFRQLAHMSLGTFSGLSLRADMG